MSAPLRCHRSALCALLVFTGACCNERLAARAFTGHLDPAQCHQLLQHPDSPYTINCPGEEVTVCWEASGESVTQVQVTLSTDPTHPATMPTSGAIYLHPTRTTGVSIRASSCASWSKDITVLNSNETKEFDAVFTSPTTLSHQIDPAFVSANVKAIADEAAWRPVIEFVEVDPYGYPTTYTVDCSYPPFLDATHPGPTRVSFPIDYPFRTVDVPGRPQAIGDWDYAIRATCPLPWTPEAFARLPFHVTLSCH